MRERSDWSYAPPSSAFYTRDFTNLIQQTFDVRHLAFLLAHAIFHKRCRLHTALLLATCYVIIKRVATVKLPFSYLTIMFYVRMKLFSKLIWNAETCVP